jgi:hypothetical protein
MMKTIRSARVAALFTGCMLALAALSPAHAQEEKEYATVKGWRVFSGPAAIAGGDMCYASKDNGQAELRIGTDEGGEWVMGMPYYEDGEVQGQFGFDSDGMMEHATFAASNGWAYMVAPAADALRNSKVLSMELDRGQQDFKLTGSAAAMTKVEECVMRGGRPPKGAQAAAPAEEDEQPEEQAAGDGVKKWQVGEWELTRNPPSGESDSNNPFCTAEAIVGQEKAIQFGYEIGYFTYGFLSLEETDDGSEIPVDVWFDGDRSTLQKVQAALVTDQNGMNWRQVVETSDEPTSAEPFRNEGSFHVSYKAEGKKRTDGYPLDGAAAALDALFACARGEDSGPQKKADTKPVRKADAKAGAKQGRKTVTEATAPVEDDAYRFGKGCPKLGAVVSDDTGRPTKVEFRYEIADDRATLIYWLDFEGRPVEQAMFDSANPIVKLDSFVGHSFIVKDFDGTCYGDFFQAQAGKNIFVVQ